MDPAPGLGIADFHPTASPTLELPQHRTPRRCPDRRRASVRCCSDVGSRSDRDPLTIDRSGGVELQDGRSRRLLLVCLRNGCRRPCGDKCRLSRCRSRLNGRRLDHPHRRDRRRTHARQCGRAGVGRPRPGDGCDLEARADARHERRSGIRRPTQQRQQRGKRVLVGATDGRQGRHDVCASEGLAGPARPGWRGADLERAACPGEGVQGRLEAVIRRRRRRTSPRPSCPCTLRGRPSRSRRRACRRERPGSRNCRRSDGRGSRPC